MTESELIQFKSMDEINVGCYMMIKNYPCKITEKSVSKTGKHGSAKTLVEGKDIFTDKKHAQIYKSSDKVQIPVVTQINYIVRFTREHIDFPDCENIYVINGTEVRTLPIVINKTNPNDLEISKKINKLLNCYLCGDCLISVIQAMNQERVIQCVEFSNFLS